MIKFWPPTVYLEPFYKAATNLHVTTSLSKKKKKKKTTKLQIYLLHNGHLSTLWDTVN